MDYVYWHCGVGPHRHLVYLARHKPRIGGCYVEHRLLVGYAVSFQLSSTLLDLGPPC